MKLKAGIIGLGVGEAHIKGYDGHPDCEVVALCDLSDEKLAMAREKYPTTKVTNHADEILEDPRINVVSIASYDNYHYEQIVGAISNNKHIFVEKPLCLQESQATHIRALLKDKPQLKISSNLILRKSPRFTMLKRMIDTGDMGRLFYIDGDYNYGRLHKITDGWRGKTDFYSVVYGGGVHIIDLFLWLTGERVADVAAYGTNISTKRSAFRYNDTVVCILKFENGMLGKMTANFACVFPHFHALSIYGTKATFTNGLDYATVFKSNASAKKGEKIFSPYPGTHKSDLIHSFIDSIIGTSEEEVSQEDIFGVMSVCFAIERATHQSSFVSVKYI